MKVHVILKRVSLVLSVIMFFLISSSANESIVLTKYTDIKQETVVAMAAFANKLRFVESAGSQVIDSAYVVTQIDIHFGSWSEYVADFEELVNLFDSLVIIYNISNSSDRYDNVVQNLIEEEYIQTAALPCFQAYHSGFYNCLTEGLIIGIIEPLGGALHMISCVQTNFTNFCQCLFNIYGQGCN
jgi:hypothetical protein